MNTNFAKRKAYSFFTLICFFVLMPFQSQAQTWDEVIKLTASDAGEYDGFGYSVAISGDKAIVGAYISDDEGAATGSAYVFELEGGVWIENS